MRVVAMRLELLCLVCVCTLAVLPNTQIAVAVDSADSLDEVNAPPHRLVHHFDFNEREAGNLENLPMFWEAIRPEGFPRFAEGSFDEQFGLTDSVSFHLKSEGRNVAYSYVGPDTRVQPNTSYLVEAHIRPDKLEHARAWMSAHFLDEDRQPIMESLVRTRYVGGFEDESQWGKVRMYLPNAPPEARTIGLMVWVVQDPVWNRSMRIRRHIPRTDIDGGAWFDDITIYALPRLILESSSPGNVLVPGEEQSLRVVFADYSDTTLAGKLFVFDRLGEETTSFDVPVSIGKYADTKSFDVSSLPPGLYTARLDVFSNGVKILSRSLTFARLSGFLRDKETSAYPFGIVIHPEKRCDPRTELYLLRHQGVRAAKLPVWSGIGYTPSVLEDNRKVDRYLQKLVQDGFALTGVFFGAPKQLVESAGPYPRPLVELLVEEAGVWRDHLAEAVAPRASVFRWWQIGADNDTSVVNDSRLEDAIKAIQKEMIPFMNLPLLSVPGHSDFIPAARIPEARQMTLTLGKNVHHRWFASLIKETRKLSYENLTAFVEPLPADEYETIPRLIEWSRRVILARHTGVDTVYVPQTWRVRQTVEGVVGEPTEEYLILRTITTMLGDSVPEGRLPIAPGVEALIFKGDDTCVLAMWDTEAPPSGRNYAIQLGQATHQVDVWGTKVPLRRDDKRRQVVKLTPEPIFVAGIERWLVDFRMSVGMTPEKVDFGTEDVAYQLQLSNQGRKPLSGTLRLSLPPDWEAEPSFFNLTLPSGRENRLDMQLRFPHTEPAGPKVLVAQIELNQGPYYLEVPLFFELGLSDVDVWGLAIVEGDDLLLRHMVTNRASEPLNFRGSANVPGRARQYQPITNLLPGDTAVAEYRITGGAALSGQRLRLILRELNDGHRLHNLEVIVP